MLLNSLTITFYKKNYQTIVHFTVEEASLSGFDVEVKIEVKEEVGKDIEKVIESFKV